MATYISLISLTQQGEEAIRDTTQRARAFRESAEKAGVTVKEIYWTLGAYDGVAVIDAPDDETATALMLGLGAKGSVRTQTLRAFNEQEMTSILGRIA